MVPLEVICRPRRKLKKMFFICKIYKTDLLLRVIMREVLAFADY